VDVHPAHGQIDILGDAQPGHHVGVVVHAGEHDLVAGRQRFAQRAAEREAERRHVGAEDDLFGAGGVQKIGDALARGVDHGVRAAAGGERAAVIGVHGQVIFGHRVDDLLGDLRPGGVVEKDGQSAVIGGPVERWKTRADSLDIERHSGPLTDVHRIHGFYCSRPAPIRPFFRRHARGGTPYGTICHNVICRDCIF